jgi:uncharacterized linocin/CFP29 family protein
MQIRSLVPSVSAISRENDMDILKRAVAPITDAAWERLDQEARRVLKANLSARRFVDVAGPKGLSFAAVSLGRLDVPAEQPEDELGIGINKVLPLVELRARFELPIWELDNVERGAVDVDLEPLVAAAMSVARFEEQAIYLGNTAAGIVGLAGASAHPAIEVKDDEEVDLMAVLLDASEHLRLAGADGPFALALGPAPFAALQASGCCSSGEDQVKAVLGGPVVRAPFIQGGFLVSTAPGTTELTLGQELSLGYEIHDARTVRLYISESFAFRVLNPVGVVELKLG